MATVQSGTGRCCGTCARSPRAACCDEGSDKYYQDRSDEEILVHTVHILYISGSMDAGFVLYSDHRPGEILRRIGEWFNRGVYYIAAGLPTSLPQREEGGFPIPGSYPHLGDGETSSVSC